MELKATKYEVGAFGITTITLNKPQRNNGWTGGMHMEYRHLLQRAEDDPAIRVIVVTGEGKSFCVGADTAALETHSRRGSYSSGTDPSTIAKPGFGINAQFDADFAYQVLCHRVSPIIFTDWNLLSVWYLEAAHCCR